MSKFLPAFTFGTSLRDLSQLLFALTLVLVLGTRSQTGQAGPLRWLPLARLGDQTIGTALLIPVLWLASWGLLELRERKKWNWGGMALTGALGVFTLAALLSMTVSLSADGARAFSALMLGWVVYLFVINERPPLLLPLLLVMLVQGGVAVAQFAWQREVGLYWLGEMSLDPQEPGIFVVVADGQRVLRGYGLTNYPNLLGSVLALSLLLAMPMLTRLRGWRLAWAAGACTLGALGLAASFSRSAWLALAIGLAGWGAEALSRARGQWPGRQQRMAVLLPLLVTAIFLVANRELALSRFVDIANTPTERMSLAVRGSDIDVALQVIRRHPWRGVGLGNYREAARAIRPKAFVVHNVPLLVLAELGLMGGLAWLVLALAGLRQARGSGYRLGLWAALLAVGLFDTTLWLTVSWRGAVLVALLLAAVSARPLPQPGPGPRPDPASRYTAPGLR
ncbi:MAG: hypothetical protein D6775_08820 [Caldilineae bacterium]|nr:MAG: hypothetical protein D6775_08820 [Caldilineae bacterium]